MEVQIVCVCVCVCRNEKKVPDKWHVWLWTSDTYKHTIKRHMCIFQLFGAAFIRGWRKCSVRKARVSAILAFLRILQNDLLPNCGPGTSKRASKLVTTGNTVNFNCNQQNFQQKIFPENTFERCLTRRSVCMGQLPIPLIPSVLRPKKPTWMAREKCFCGCSYLEFPFKWCRVQVKYVSLSLSPWMLVLRGRVQFRFRCRRYLLLPLPPKVVVMQASSC